MGYNFRGGKVLKTKPFFVANWKMYKTYKESIEWCKEYCKELSRLSEKADIVVCPTFPALESVGSYLASCGVAWGAQDCSWKKEGALTGEVSVLSLKELGCSFCIVGHSERRRFAGETNERIAQKLSLLFAENIIPILCVGETAKGISWDQQKPILEQVITDQLSVLTNLKESTHRVLCVAYEPVWAIGTGQVPSVEHIQGAVDRINHFCKVSLADCEIHILYGGSVDPESAALLWSVNNLEGFLVGGASVSFKSFEKIVQSHR